MYAGARMCVVEALFRGVDWGVGVIDKGSRGVCMCMWDNVYLCREMKMMRMI